MLEVLKKIPLKWLSLNILSSEYYRFTTFLRTFKRRWGNKIQSINKNVVKKTKKVITPIDVTVSIKYEILAI
jgi:hypothetical protein